MEDLVDASFWRGRRVLVTGHTGFKGSWLVLWLEQLGAEVTGFACSPPTSPSMFDLCGVRDSVKHIEGDVRDLAAVVHAFLQAQPEVVIHLAAQALVRASYADPVFTYATNVMGTVHVLEAARRTPSVRVVLCVTSDKCYENREWLWGYREHERLGGYDPYSNSKACADLIASSYRRSWLSERSVALATARTGNVIGGGDWGSDRLVVDAVRAFARGTPLQVRNPEAIRPWQHVLEPLAGYLRLCERACRDPAGYSEPWNFGPCGAAVRVADIANHLASLWGQGATWELAPDAQVHEARSLSLDCSKARERLGWRPRWSLARALAATTEWYLSQCTGQRSMRELTLKQIASYERFDGYRPPHDPGLVTLEPGLA